MTVQQAKAALRSRIHPSPAVGLLIARGILQHCFVEDGLEGVTRASVQEELQWRRTTSTWRKLTRAVGGILHWV
jgi:hypothetical protein